MENSQCCFCSYEALNNEQLDEHLNLEHSTIFNDDVQQQKPTINGGEYADPKLCCKCEVRIDGFTCTYCDFKATTKQMLGFHIRKSHILYKFVGKPKPKKHLQEKIKKQSFICTDCDFETPSSQTLFDHVQDTHRQPEKETATIATTTKMYNCDMCDYTSVKAYNLQRHFNSVHLEEKEFPCRHCPMEFDFKIDLDEHMLDRHEEEEEEERLKEMKKKEKASEPRPKAVSSSSVVEIKEPPEDRWERYYCEVCNYNSDKQSDVEKHKENVHVKQQTDFATYVTRTLVRSLDTFPATPKSASIKSGKVQKKEVSSPKVTPSQSKKVKEEKKKTAAAPAAVVFTPNQSKSDKKKKAEIQPREDTPLKTPKNNGRVKPPESETPPGSKVTTESDFAVYVTRTLLKGLGNEPSTPSNSVTKKEPKMSNKKSTAATNEVQKETTPIAKQKFENKSSTHPPPEKKTKEVKKKETKSTKAPVSVQHKDTNGHKDNADTVYHDIVPDQSDFASYVTRHLLKNLSDTPVPEEPKITPKAKKNQNKKTPSAAKKPKVEPKQVIPNSDSDDSDSDEGNKFDLKKMKFPISTRRPEPAQSIKHVSSDHFSSDSDTDKYTLKKMTTAVAKKGRNFSSIDIIHSDENATGTERSPEGTNKKTSTKKSKVVQLPENFDSDGSGQPLITKAAARKMKPVPIQADLNSSDSDTDKYELKQMTTKAVKRSKTKQPVTDIPEHAEPKKPTKSSVLAKLLKSKASTKNVQRKSEPINRFLDTHTSDEDILPEPVPEKKVQIVKPKAKRLSKKKYYKYKTIDERFDSLFGQDLSSTNASFNSAPNESRGKYSSDSSDSDLDLDDDDEIPIVAPKKSQKKTPKSAPPKLKSKPKKKKVAKEKIPPTKEDSFLETSDEEEETKIPQSSKSVVAHEMPAMQNDYANYVTRTLLKAITTVEHPKPSSSVNYSKSKTPAKKTPKQKDSSKKKGSAEKAESEKADNRIEYSSSDDEPLRPTNQKDVASSVARKVVKNFSEDSDKDEPTKKSGQKRKSSSTPKTVKKKLVPQLILDSSPEPEPMKQLDLARLEENSQGDFAMYVTRRLVKSLPH